MYGLNGGTQTKMASKESIEFMSKEERKSFILTEEDIPGASLPRETADECSVVQLKRWLVCRGAKTTGKKAFLVTRVKNYINNGLDKKYLRDPDDGVNVLRKKADLGLLEKAEPELRESFPKEGLKDDLSNIPKISFGTIWRYMIDGVNSKKQLSTAKPLVKGYNFFKSGNVLSILFLRENGKSYFKSQILPSMRKDVVYQCYIVLSSIGCVLRAYCGCPAGIDGRCNHVSATLFGLEDYCKEREKHLDDESPTSRPCKWNIPKKRKGNVVPIAAMNFTKHDYSRKTKLERKPAMKPGQDVRALHQREWSTAKVKYVLEQIQDYQKTSGNVVGWSHILPQQVPHQESDETEQINIESDVHNNSFDKYVVSPIKELPPSLSSINTQCAKIKRKLMLDETEISDIERKTKDQSNNNLWHFHRKCRLTASKCHRVATLRPSTSPTKALREVLKYDKQFQSQAMKEGLEKENEIIQMYVKTMHDLGHKELLVEKCGLYISQSHGFLAATPDGIVTDPSSSSPHGLLEMKYIQLNSSENLNEALLRKRICINKGPASLKMNTKHQYYYQIFQQMFVTKCVWTDFVVKGSNGDDLYVERICFNKSLWEDLLPKLETFFDSVMLPELSYPRVKYGLTRFDFRGI